MARPVRVSAPALLLLAATVCGANTARAQACGRPDLEFAVPPDGATGVPTNARLAARYALSADYLDEPVFFQKASGPDTEVTPSWNGAERILTVTPATDLESGVTYVVKWPRLRGIASASKGRGREVTFTVGDRADEEAPRFRGLVSVDWDLDRESDECTDSLEDRYVFDLSLEPGRDDGGRDSLTLLVFQTRGPNVGSVGAPQAVFLSQWPVAPQVSISRPIDVSTGNVCFAAIARDLTGKISTSSSDEVCTRTIAPPFFSGCRVGRRADPSARGWWVGPAVALGATRRRRRRKRA